MPYKGKEPWQAGLWSQLGVDARTFRLLRLAAVEEATNGWHQSRAHPGTGNDSFFSLALSLRSAGMSLDQIEEKLEEQAKFALSPDERKSQISSIMKSLQLRKAG